MQCNLIIYIPYYINIHALYFHYNLNIAQNVCLLSLALGALLIFGHPVLPKKTRYLIILCRFC